MYLRLTIFVVNKNIYLRLTIFVINKNICVFTTKIENVKIKRINLFIK